MERENLFRGKRIDNGEWVEGYYYSECGLYYIFENRQAESMLNRNHPYAVVPETIGQFTGMLDREKRQIFKGDILRLYMGQIVEVRFINGCFSFYLNEKSHSPFDDLECRNSTVIGNITDNSELFTLK